MKSLLAAFGVSMAVVCAGCADEPDINNEYHYDCPDAAPPPVVEGPAAMPAWSNCGRPWAFPYEACQVRVSDERLSYEVTIALDAKVEAISVTVDPAGDSKNSAHSSDPARHPRLYLHSFDAGANVWRTLGPAVDNTPLLDYEQPHALMLSPDDLDELHMVATQKEGYHHVIEVEGESGPGALTGLRITEPVVLYK